MPKRRRFSAKDIAYIGLFIALMAVCAWLTIPFAVSFTMQTFAVMLAGAMLGARRGTVMVLSYLALGLIGLPVFSGFSGGFGVLLGPTGGYLIGFLIAVPVIGGLLRLMGRKYWMVCIGMACGMIVCYAFGTAWYMLVYLREAGEIGLAAALAQCVIPFLLPDAAKLMLAAWIAKRFDRIKGEQG